MKTGVFFLACLLMTGQLCRAAQTYRFDTTNSAIQIHLGTSGLMRAAGHEHLIRTPVQQGSFVFDPRAPNQSTVEFVVDAKRLKVVDQGISAKDREKIQATMESNRVLDLNQFPTIRFKSTSIESDGANQLLVRGNLSIRDKTRSVTVQVRLTQQTPELQAVGVCQFKQTEFGIKPVTAVLGTVRVRDLMTIEFVIKCLPVKSP